MTTRALLRNRTGAAGLAIVLSLVALAVLSIEFGPSRRSLLTRSILTYGPHDEDRAVQRAPSPPDARHLLGTDIQRRDVLSRLLHGSKISLQIGLSAMALSLAIGLSLGAIAAHRGGWLDSLLMRLADLLLAFPLPIVAMAAIAVFESRSATLVLVVLGLMGWAGIARLVRAQCLSVSSRGYPEAARAMGASGIRLVARHMVPNALAPAMVAAAVGVAMNILTEAWLAFIGLGVEPPAVSWGRMIDDAQPHLVVRPWLCIFPGLALGITVLGFMLLADGLRDVLDPKTTTSHTGRRALWRRGLSA